ncbi:Glucosamine-6-phosphate deaminase 1 [Pirellulimonas nuda]|uniref:Glucosamine-6-phosphate deaminase 1 n=1 Tax=Pirellulimonas nuda TaxID=2528009 RepID=A0A518DDX9_9BACT|nr:glucosamine-6-phosphate deaminase [Pirellulimonas nuda]QDU89691.1 Glucosamine-6-phosphate deaminase 1 [Pirellulimonas nuda]
MIVHKLPTAQAAGTAAAGRAADLLRAALASPGHANLLVATGASQLGLLSALAAEQGIDWRRVVGFHLDEYIGIGFTHSASFRNYLWSRFLSKLPMPMAAFHYIEPEPDPQAECQRLAGVLAAHPIDLALIGIGENGHLAFNDPPADFQTQRPYLCVELDEACRLQQHREGWFETLEEVPTRAITMSVRQILASRRLVCTAPDQRKAAAVRDALTGPITPDVPASILQTRADAELFLDEGSASLLPADPHDPGPTDPDAGAALPRPPIHPTDE